MLTLPVSVKRLCVIRAPDRTSTTSKCSKYAIWNPAELSSTFILMVVPPNTIYPSAPSTLQTANNIFRYIWVWRCWTHWAGEKKLSFPHSTRTDLNVNSSCFPASYLQWLSLPLVSATEVQCMSKQPGLHKSTHAYFRIGSLLFTFATFRTPFLQIFFSSPPEHKYWIASRHSCKSTTFVYKRDKCALLPGVVVNFAGQPQRLKRCLFLYAWEGI